MLAPFLWHAGTMHPAMPLFTAVLIAAGPWAAAPAHADVMVINDGQAQWVAGGPGGGSTPHHARGRLVAPPPGAIPVAWRHTLDVLADRYDLSPAIIEALVWQESRWQAGAVSPKGARGLAQLMPQTARDLGANADNPVENVAAGARYLHALMHSFHGNLEEALAAYNAGPARVVRAGGVPPIAETQRYVAAILTRLAAQTTPRQ